MVDGVARRHVAHPPRRVPRLVAVKHMHENTGLAQVVARTATQPAIVESDRGRVRSRRWRARRRARRRGTGERRRRSTGGRRRRRTRRWRWAGWWMQWWRRARRRTFRWKCRRLVQQLHRRRGWHGSDRQEQSGGSTSGRRPVPSFRWLLTVRERYGGPSSAAASAVAPKMFTVRSDVFRGLGL